MKKEDITCPYCGKKNTWVKTNKFRPFCSERCKMIDLGKWADESHRIPSHPGSEDSEARDEEQ